MPKLDEIASVDEQEQWLLSGASSARLPDRAFPQLSDEQYDTRLAELTNSPEWDSIRSFMRRYIENFIFKPDQTEKIWWNATIQNNADFLRVNIWRQEVLIFYIRADEISQQISSGAIWVPTEDYEIEFERGFRLLPTFQILKGHTGNSLVQIGISFQEAPLESVLDFFSQPWLMRSIRRLNLDLMRGGKLSFDWGKYHSAKLVEAIFAVDASVENATQNFMSDSLEEQTEIPDTVVQRLVWMRKNQKLFSNPVKLFWDSRCAVTGIEAPSLLEACHIKPFSDSEEFERGDSFNGICLAVHIHKAFDAHLISFDFQGAILLSARLSLSDRERMGLNENIKITFDERHRAYIEYHHARILKENSG